MAICVSYSKRARLGKYAVYMSTRSICIKKNLLVPWKQHKKWMHAYLDEEEEQWIPTGKHLVSVESESSTDSA